MEDAICIYSRPEMITTYIDGWYNNRQISGQQKIIKSFPICWLQRVVSTQKQMITAVLDQCGDDDGDDGDVLPKGIRPELLLMEVYSKDHIHNSASCKHVDDESFRNSGIGIGATSMCLLQHHVPKIDSDDDDDDDHDDNKAQNDDESNGGDKRSDTDDDEDDDDDDDNKTQNGDESNGVDKIDDLNDTGMGGVYLYPNCTSRCCTHHDCDCSTNKTVIELNNLETLFIPYGIWHESKNPRCGIMLNLIFLWMWPSEITKRRRISQRYTEIVSRTYRENPDLFKFSSESFLEAWNRTEGTWI